MKYSSAASETVNHAYNAILDTLLAEQCGRADAASACLAVVAMQVVGRALTLEELEDYIKSVGTYIALYFTPVGKETTIH